MVRLGRNRFTKPLSCLIEVGPKARDACQNFGRIRKAPRPFEGGGRETGLKVYFVLLSVMAM
jgi:hypothetical protein